MQQAAIMHDSIDALDFGPAVHLVPGSSGGTGAEVIFVCEHASNRIPDGLRGLGLSDEARQSHIAWDPGALDLARTMAAQTGSTLVHGGISRLVYDCNRPPEADSAIPERSEAYAIPGNAGLPAEVRQARVDAIYRPFHDQLAERIRALRPVLSLMVTVHSFTPVYHGQRRAVEIGILHGKDPAFAQAMMRTAPPDTAHITRLNEPYSAADGVAHTLDMHGAVNGLASVMLEVRSDLIATEAQQARMAALFVQWIGRTRAGTERGAAT
jgi:predicted N-formylglutamate amidohydrolase